MQDTATEKCDNGSSYKWDIAPMRAAEEKGEDPEHLGLQDISISLCSPEGTERVLEGFSSIFLYFRWILPLLFEGAEQS